MEDEKVQLLMKLPRHVKERAQRQASLAYHYKWIETPTVTQLFIWTVDYFLDKAIKETIKKRREVKQ